MWGVHEEIGNVGVKPGSFTQNLDSDELSGQDAVASVRLEPYPGRVILQVLPWHSSQDTQEKQVERTGFL